MLMELVEIATKWDRGEKYKIGKSIGKINRQRQTITYEVV
jgi:hypothetical protein